MPLASFALSALLFAAPCPTTLPSTPLFMPPPSLTPALESQSFWFGTPQFWTQLPGNGKIARRDKVFWWYPGFDGSLEPQPNLSVSVKRWGSTVASFVDAHPTNAFFGGTWSMLTMLEFPSGGCWEVTGTYRDRSLTFVAAVP